jgi:hypothetical protein
MKLTPTTVEVVRQALKRGLTYREIADLTNINISTISTIAYCSGLSRPREDANEERTKTSVVKALTEILQEIKKDKEGDAN